MTVTVTVAEAMVSVMHKRLRQLAHVAGSIYYTDNNADADGNADKDTVMKEGSSGSRNNHDAAWKSSYHSIMQTSCVSSATQSRAVHGLGLTRTLDIISFPFPTRKSG